MSATRNALSVTILMLSLGACAPTNDPMPETPPTADAPPPAMSSPMPPEATPRMPPADGIGSDCNADAAQSMVGKTATAQVMEQAKAAAGAGMVRTLKPDQMVTMEFRGDRLNLDVDADNVITAVRCG